MIKLNVFNLEEFLQLMKECAGPVKMLCPDGSQQDITRQDQTQPELRRRHSDNRHCLELTLDIPNPRDYLKIVYFTIGDC